MVHEIVPKVQYIINKYERNPGAADIDDNDDDESDDADPNVQYIIEQPGSISYTDVKAEDDGTVVLRDPKYFNTSLIVTDNHNNRIELIPHASDPNKSSDNHTLHLFKSSFPKTMVARGTPITKKGGSKTCRKGARKLMTTRKQKSKGLFRKSRSTKGGSKTKRTEVCRLCEKEFTADDEIPKLKCKHKFHKKCLKPVCLRTNNHNVMCPVEGCGGHIGFFECAADISRDAPWEYDPFDSTDGNSLFDAAEWTELTDDERSEVSKEIKKRKTKYSAQLRAFVNSDATAEERIDHLFAEDAARTASAKRQAESHKASVLKLTGRMP
jgi:predicted Fe-S protein YdhL (DUF1289 family)